MEKQMKKQEAIEKQEAMETIFNLFNALIKQTDNQKKISSIIESLLIFVHDTEDKDLITNFKSCWLETKAKLKKKYGTEFNVQERRIDLRIDKILVPQKKY